MTEEGIDDHHIFPDDYLKKSGVDVARTRNCILNRTLIDRKTNQMISNRAPSDYLKQIKDTDGFPFDAVLASHLLPTGEDSPLLADDFDSFLSWRQDRLWQQIKRVTGISEASDLEENETAGSVAVETIIITPQTEGRPPDLSGSHDFAVINEYGHNFDGYEVFGGSEALVKVAERVAANHDATGEWQGTIDELRGTLFFMLRQQRHWGYGADEGMSIDIMHPDGTTEEHRGEADLERLEEFRSLYTVIRDRWDEVDPG
ncbi:MAG: hypothetical protein IPO41_07260 [Acidobacteria bacterium]|nr:hypothetical protein [Acidobacteriota bacterium]